MVGVLCIYSKEYEYESSHPSDFRFRWFAPCDWLKVNAAGFLKYKSAKRSVCTPLREEAKDFDLFITEILTF